jgi:hypothetical protein
MATKRGFIIDAPNALIVSGDATYNLITATSGQVQFQGSSLEIKGGWSLYDLISIPTGTTLSVTLSDARIDGDMLEMGMGATKKEASKEPNWYFGDSYVVDGTDYTIKLAHKIDEGSFKINHMKATTSTPTKGEYKLEIGDEETVVTFSADMAGQEVIPSFSVTEEAETYDALNDSLAKKGMVILKFPVYAGDAVNSGIEAICQITIYSASINQNTTIGGSYKTASSFNLDIKGLDSKRPDKKIWSVAFFPYKASA